MWDVRLLIQEIEEKLSTRVIDIPAVNSGSNSYVSEIFIFHDPVPETEVE